MDRHAEKRAFTVSGAAWCRGIVEDFQVYLNHLMACHAGFCGGGAVDYGAIETELSAHLRALERRGHQHLLAALAVNAACIWVWGREYRPACESFGVYYTMAGSVRVSRMLYRRVGDRGGGTIDPIEVRTGALDGWLPCAAEAMGHFMGQGTSREGAQSTKRMQRLLYSRSSFERVGHATGEDLVGKAERILPAVVKEMDVPADAVSVSISTDRVNVPMEEKPDTKAAVAWKTPRIRRASEKTLSEEEFQAHCDEADPAIARRCAEADEAVSKQAKIERNFRQAYVTTLTLHDEAGKALLCLRAGKMPDPEDVIKRGATQHYRLMRALLELMRDKRPDLKPVLLADGAPELWKWLETFLRPEDVAPHADTKCLRIIDFWHVCEYLGAAAKVLETHGTKPGQLGRWKNALLNQDGAAAAIVAELRASGLAMEKVGEAYPVDAAITYMGKRIGQLNYAEARRNGLPIGSGNVEATCKSLVNVRMKRPGSRWKQKTGDEVVMLRALQLSDLWEPTMERLFASRRKPIRVDGEADVLPTARLAA